MNESNKLLFQNFANSIIQDKTQQSRTYEDIFKKAELITAKSNGKRCPFADTKKPFVLQNLLDGTQVVDTLHHQTAVKQVCTQEACLGSIYMPDTNDVEPGELRPVEQLKEDAMLFLKEYFKCLNKENSTEHLVRVQEVLKEVDTNGTYDLEKDELIFGARLAWRNVPRCSGRITWKKLELLDYRHVKTAKEMYEAILHYIEYITNGGNIRSTITVFPHKKERMSEFRIWNSQMLKYAGYKQSDGSVVGDPASVKFTEICESMGWKGAHTNFDILPLVLSAPGQPPEIFEIPKKLILEVEIKHPGFPKLADLGLKWYSVPSISNMMLDCGGLQFTACPFNGWYNATEIGARNFVDINRYNLLKPMAKCFGLDTSNPSTLWKDKTVVEITSAVITSFQEAGVTIVDHHTASEGFMKFLKDEERLRGGCPTDWVWVVPPMSGALTPMFHQEFMNYKLRPSYEYQTDPWTYLPDAKLKSSSGKRKTFKSVSRAAYFLSHLMTKAIKKRHKVRILYASESGRSETFASTLKDLFLNAFNPTVTCMDEYDVSRLKDEECVLVVTSTFGNGDSPDNGKQFEGHLHDILRKIATKEDKKEFQKLRYSVFALGSTAYPDFCAFGHLINEMFQQLGGVEIAEMMEGDELSAQEESFEVWSENVFKAACKLFQLEPATIDTTSSIRANSTREWRKEEHRLTTNQTSESLISGLSLLHHKEILAANCISVENLQSPDSNRITNLVKIKRNESLVFQSGDHLAVYPNNEQSLVNELLKRIILNVDVDIPVRMEYMEDDLWMKSTKIPFAATIRQMFTSFLDITTPPTEKFLSMLLNQCVDETEKKELKLLSSDLQKYNEWAHTSHPNILELIQKFPSLQCEVTFLIEKLPILKPRLYSISSSPNLFPNEVHITSSLVTYQVDDNMEHHGVCSHFLNKLNSGDVIPVSVRSAPSFHLPSSPSTPIIMIGPGTGIAPFRSFWQEALHDETNNQRDKARKIALYFGCRNPNHDDIYLNERDEARNKGIINKMFTAYSRQSGAEKVYVQDILLQHAEDVKRWMTEENGEVFVCGDVNMAANVKEVMRTILNACSNEEDDYVHYLHDCGRYHEDIFGTLHDGQRRRCLS